MSEQVIVLGPGQGAQAVGMGKAWCAASAAAREVFAQADAFLGDRLGAPLSAICFEGPTERVNQTDVAQPAIYVTSVACWRGLVEKGILDESAIAATAGLSLGEYTALHLAGVFSFEDGLKLVAERGKLMQEAAEASESGMVALTRATEEQAETICNEARGGGVLVCANFNAPGQIVLSGSKDACDRALKSAEEHGIRATPLPVAGAFHSPLMQPAADRMGEILETVDFRSPQVPVVSNVTAMPHDPENPTRIRQFLVEQIVSSVKWNQSCDWFVNNMSGVKMLELAPGRVLSGLMRRIHKESEVINYDAPPSNDDDHDNA